jgi:type VI secretion system secreted protein Hcp
MAVDMFLKLTGITGEAKDSVHKGEIDILAWSWGVSNSGSAHQGGGAGSGKANFQDLSFTKYVDLSSTSLYQAASSGKHITKGTLVVRKAGDTPLEYLTIDMNEILVSSVSGGGSGGEDRLTENVSMNFSSFKISYKEQTSTGAAGGAPTFGWDISKNAVLAA